LCNQRLNCSCLHGKWWANCLFFFSGTRIRLFILFIYPSVYLVLLRTNNSQGTSMWLHLQISLVNVNKLSTSFVIVLLHYWVEYNWNHDISLTNAGHYSLTFLSRLINLITLFRYRGSTVVKVLCYKSEGRWFDSRCCHRNLSLT